MKTVTFNIEDSIFEETETILSQMKTSRNTYINKALDYYNRLQKRMIMDEKLRNESDLAKADALHILEDFEGIDYAE
jgi:hypothetical protein